MDAGLVRFIGVSNFSLKQVGHAGCASGRRRRQQGCLTRSAGRLLRVGGSGGRLGAWQQGRLATWQMLRHEGQCNPPAASASPSSSIHMSTRVSSQVEEVLSFARIKPVVNQIELHPLLAQRKLVGVCLRKVGSCQCNVITRFSAACSWHG